jgi:hypothetical protein
MFDHGSHDDFGMLPIRGQERFRNQARDAIGDSGHHDLIVRRDRTRGLQSEATSDNPKAAQNQALGFRVQLIAPVECGPQCLLAMRCRTTATCEKPETIVKPGRNALDPQGRGARYRELDRQQDAAQAAANTRDRPQGAGIRRKRRISRARPLDKQANGAVAKRVPVSAI